jgi:SNF2 family DNA or RNA helicase
MTFSEGPHLFLHGGVPARKREEMVARFQAGEVPVFLLSLKVGGSGRGGGPLGGTCETRHRR